MLCKTKTFLGFEVSVYYTEMFCVAWLVRYLSMDKSMDPAEPIYVIALTCKQR